MSNCELYPLRLERKLDRRLWGGQRLAAWLQLPKPWPPDLAESWQVYAENRVLNGAYAGRTLAELCEMYGADLIGTLSLPRYGHTFPLLAKFLDANARLSVQVHPDDEYAHTVEAHTGFHGKTEAWYILDAQPGAQLIYGLKEKCDRETFAKALADGTLESLFNLIEVKAGDVVYVPAGTLHAINEGILLFEIQQTSDLTYRVYDYNRRDAQGNLRPLHLDKALDVIRYEPPAQGKIPPLVLEPGREVLVACPYFALERHQLNHPRRFRGMSTSFDIWTVLEGKVTIADESLRQGDSLVIPACYSRYDIVPETSAILLRCYIPDLQKDLIQPLQKRGYSPVQIQQTIRPAPNASRLSRQNS